MKMYLILSVKVIDVDLFLKQKNSYSYLIKYLLR